MTRPTVPSDHIWADLEQHEIRDLGITIEPEPDDPTDAAIVLLLLGATLIGSAILLATAQIVMALTRWFG